MSYLRYVHPPEFRPDHLLSDWPECRLEIRCPKCGRSSFYPTRMMRQVIGDHTFDAVLKKLKCESCGTRPAPVYLLAGWHREHCWGAPPGWAIELVRKP